MTDKILWINRIVSLVFYCIGIYICERFKLAPGWCFAFAVFWLIFMTFVFEVIKRILE